MADINYRPIGVIHSPFESIEGMPIQPSGGEGIRGTVELYPEFAPGLKDVAGFSHLILIYHFHQSHGYDLELKPFLDDTLRGVFATRAPRRPNPIGLSVVKLVRVDGCALHIDNVDILDGTPLLDIKPYVSAFELVSDERTGWLSQRAKEARAVKSDKRFR
jgi:tRNA-Thr(GGU) m(6)t(6)A37 methyltransferase TsaA